MTEEAAGQGPALSEGLGRTPLSGRDIKQPHKLNDDAIVLAGLAETLQRRFDEAHHEGGIDDAMNLSWAYEALAQLAKTLADNISDYAA